jgi:hypothetical protein
MLACLLEPLSVAVRVAVWPDVIVPAAAVNVAVEAPEVTETEAGTVRTPVAELVMVTLVPAVAAWLRVMVQVVDAFEAREAAAHVNELMLVGATSEMVACWLEPLSEAVRVAVWPDVIVPAAAVNVAVVPVVTATEAGTVRTPVAELVMVTLVLVVAAWLKVMVQVVDAFEAREAAAHVRELMLVGATREIVACWVEPLSEAVTVAV